MSLKWRYKEEKMKKVKIKKGFTVVNRMIVEAVIVKEVKCMLQEKTAYEIRYIDKDGNVVDETVSTDMVYDTIDECVNALKNKVQLIGDIVMDEYTEEEIENLVFGTAESELIKGY